MTTQKVKSGYAKINQARIHYETAGAGTPFVMIHAGVADCRQWDNEFGYFAEKYRVVRYDMRGYGRSEPVEGDFSHLEDLLSLLDRLDNHEPMILMGCSMGGSLAMDFALAHPSRTKALIMVDSGPSGLKLDIPDPAKFADAEKAYEEGNLDLVAEIETQIWFDGTGRTHEQVDQRMRKLVYEMNRNALDHEAKNIGKRLPDTQAPAFDRLHELKIPVMIIVGEHDTGYIWAAADYMIQKIPTWTMVGIEDAAHLPNMDHPRRFRTILEDFLDDLPNEEPVR